MPRKCGTRGVRIRVWHRPDCPWPTGARKSVRCPGIPSKQSSAQSSGDAKVKFRDQKFRKSSEVPGKASMGSWLTYGLGSESNDLPAFVVFTPKYPLDSNGQALFSRMWNSGFLPTRYNGVALRGAADAFLLRMTAFSGFMAVRWAGVAILAAGCALRIASFKGEGTALSRPGRALQMVGLALGLGSLAGTAVALFPGIPSAYRDR